MSKNTELSTLEMNTLYTFAPYENGAEVDINTFKPDVRDALIRLINSDYITKKGAANGLDRFQLTEKGNKAAFPSGSSRVYSCCDLIKGTR